MQQFTGAVGPAVPVSTSILETFTLLHCCMKQYMPKKPIKQGFKGWVRADSLSWYVCQFQCYTGKQGSTVEVGLGGNVVTALTRDLVGRHNSVYMGQFFLQHTTVSEAVGG